MRSTRPDWRFQIRLLTTPWRQGFAPVVSVAWAAAVEACAYSKRTEGKKAPLAIACPSPPFRLRWCRSSVSDPRPSTVMNKASLGGAARTGAAVSRVSATNVLIIRRSSSPSSTAQDFGGGCVFTSRNPAVTVRRLDRRGQAPRHLRRHRSDGRRLLRELPPLLRVRAERVFPRQGRQLPRVGKTGQASPRRRSALRVQGSRPV